MIKVMKRVSTKGDSQERRQAEAIAIISQTSKDRDVVAEDSNTSRRGEVQ